MNPIRRNLVQRLKSIVVLTVGGSGIFTALCIYQGNERFYRNVFMPVVHKLFDAETAHSLAIAAAKWKLVPRVARPDSSLLSATLWGLHFPNPLGLAAGFDKNAETIDAMFSIGFGFVEVGSITPLEQPGNEKPRIFRLPEDFAVINRCGFNNKGHENVMRNIQSQTRPGILGVNLGKNKNTESAFDDYVAGISKFGYVADYFVINVSSPNTPGLRALQKVEVLENLLNKVIEERSKLISRRPPILIKITADLNADDLRDIAKLLLKKKDEIGGLVVSNTTITRPASLKNPLKKESGGLSGKPLRERSTMAIAEMFMLTNGEIPIIGVGGVFSGADAYEKICAGASLIQIYTAVVYEGPPVVAKIKRELEELLQTNGYNNYCDAVGSSHRKQRLQ